MSCIYLIKIVVFVGFGKVDKEIYVCLFVFIEDLFYWYFYGYMLVFVGIGKWVRCRFDFMFIVRKVKEGLLVGFCGRKRGVMRVELF